MKVGRGTEPDVKVGPLIDDAQRGKVAELVDDAREQRRQGAGRRLAHRRRRATSTSRPCWPTCPTTHACSGEEIFGPVAPVKGFASDEEAIAAANDTEYGLVAYVYTQDINRAFRVIEGLETGMIGLNQGMVSNAGAPVRRRQAVGLRPRGRPRGHRRVPRDQVRGAERAVVPRFVDLSAPITATPPELPDLLRTDIEFSGHAEGAQTIEAMLGVPPALLRDAKAGRWRRSCASARTTPPTSTRPGTTTRPSPASARRPSTSCRWSGSTRPASCSTSARARTATSIDAPDVEAELGASATRSRRWTSCSCARAATPSTPSSTTWRAARA